MPQVDKNGVVLVTGQAGLRIGESLTKLCKAYNIRGTPLKVETNMIKLHLNKYRKENEKGEFEGPGGLQELLLRPKPYLKTLWQKSLKEIRDKITKGYPNPFVCFHSVFHHTQHEEFFTCVDCKKLKKLKPRLILTFIDDIYDVEKRLREPDQIHDPKYTGENSIPPFFAACYSILNLINGLDWRSQEISLTSVIASELKIPHILLAVKHPLSVAYDIIFSPKTLVYLSHPITEPRKARLKGEIEKAEQIEEEITELTRRLIDSTTVTPLLPSTIDELRLEQDGELPLPRLLPRLPLLGSPEDLLFIPPKVDTVNLLDPLSFFETKPEESYMKAISTLLYSLREKIRQQLNTRDHYLVFQSQAIVAYRPYWDGHKSDGMSEEIEYRDRLIKYGAFGPYRRPLIAFNNPEDFLLYQLKTFVEELASKSSKAPSVEAIIEGLKSDAECRQRFEKGTWTHQQLEEKIVNKIGEIHFRDLPTRKEVGPLRGPPPTKARFKTKEIWGELAQLANDGSKCKSPFIKRGDHWIEESLTPIQFVRKIEDKLVNKNHKGGDRVSRDHSLR